MADKTHDKSNPRKCNFITEHYRDRQRGAIAVRRRAGTRQWRDSFNSSSSSLSSCVFKPEYELFPSLSKHQKFAYMNHK